MKVWKTILLDGCVMLGTLIFISATVAAVLMDLYYYISSWVCGKNIGGFSLTLTSSLFEQLGTVVPIFAFAGLCIGLMIAWQNTKTP